MDIETPAENYDIVVVGGGMVGASFAQALSQSLKEKCPSVLVIEAAGPDTAKELQPSFDARSTALSFGSRQIYESMQLWDGLQDCVTPIHEIQVSDKGRLGSALLNRGEQNVEALGYVVENASLGVVLNARMQTSSVIEFLAPATIENISPVPNGMKLSVSNGEGSYAIHAGLVVLADGGRSPICQQLGIEQAKESYRQHAIISNVSFEQAHNNIAFERFTDSGPLAILPLRNFEGENRCSLVWTVEDENSNALMQFDDEEFIEALQQSFGNRLGRITGIGDKFCYPLSLSIAKEQIRPGIVLLGNVAHTLHPVAGQGLNLALRDISALVDALKQAVVTQESLGSMNTLQSYIDRQDFDQQKAILFTDSLTKLFSSNRGTNVASRKLGLLSLEIIPAVRKSFAEQAMGLVAR
ncbi:MAG: 2-octaprenyl-6-methoxyphenyl hydroxylase [Gammaproteobacteria bacterium]|nr:2-octaprenyl-6-methoxyphenyl hydroxylase [Gammaproteobacteria bacterium]MDD9894895.1 2-octaprenyl-6-methoxyphenyl hydroxylase [Gammaproteobacteria bacterium]MDD9958850.1 2-octaprenyl-6-methoxyphenyl hydroxylase [Gammaproteobacteria bacterium]